MPNPLFSDVAVAPAGVSFAAPATASRTTPTLPAQALSGTFDADLESLAQSARSGYASVSEKLLATHKTADAGEMGEKLNALLVTAKGLAAPTEHPGLLEHLFFRAKSEKERILAHTQSIKKRLDELDAQVVSAARLQQQRIQDMEGIKQENLAFEQHIQAGLQQLQAWQQAAAESPQAVLNPAEKQEAEHREQRLAVLIGEFQNTLILCQQQRVQTQIAQDNARAILDESDQARNLAIPSLIQNVTMQLIALEQQDTLKTGTAIRDMLNESMLQAAKTLGQNQETVATLQQTQMVKLDTLEQVQGILEQTAQKVKQIEAQGAQQRQLDIQRRDDLQRRMMSA